MGLTLAFGLSGAVAVAAENAVKDELVIGITQYPANMHPSIDAMMAKSYVLGFARRPLTVHNQDWELVCMMCTELPTISNGKAKIEELDDGQKGIQMTFSIPENAKWGDGTAITSKDVVFTWEVGKHPLSGVTNFELYDRITKIDVIDDSNFTIHINKLTYDYNALNDFRILPEHLERKVFEADPVEYKNRTLYQTDPTNKGLYFGPYRVSDAVNGSHIALEPNDAWWGAKPKFKRITVRTIENTSALEANLLSGAIDMIAGELGFKIDQGVAFEERHADNYQIIFKPSLVYEHIDFNLDNPILQDEKVRKAMIHALDRQTLTEQLFSGYQPVAHTFVHPLDWIFYDGVASYEHNVEKAATLLDEAGWKDMKDGVRHNAKGEALSLEFMTTAGDRTRERVQQVLQDQWKRLGIEVRIQNQPARVLFGETIIQRKFTALAMYAWLSPPANVPLMMLHSKQIPSKENNYAGENIPGYKSAKMDELIDRLEVELDVTKREELWNEIQSLYAADLPVIPLFYRADMHVLPKWLAGYEPTGHQYPTSLWVENWRGVEAK